MVDWAGVCGPAEDYGCGDPDYDCHDPQGHCGGGAISARAVLSRATQPGVVRPVTCNRCGTAGLRWAHTDNWRLVGRDGTQHECDFTQLFAELEDTP